MAETESVARPESIGAHFSLGYRRNPSVFTDGWCYASARSGLFAVLSACRPKLLHVPNFICPVVFDACEAACVPIRKYRMNSLLTPELPSLRAGEIVLVANYFGLSEELVKKVVVAFGSERVIIDSAQGFFMPHHECLATLYSPRKFLPVADGGVVRSSLSLRVDPADAEASLRRSSYLLSRIGSAPELSRSAYLEAEKSLGKIGFDGMSALTRALAETFDLDFIRKTRRENFRTLTYAFGSVNQLTLKLGDQVPLCYPLVINGADKIYGELIKRRVFLPRLWPGVVANTGFETQMMESALHLPVDHRYRSVDMDYLVNVIKEISGGI